MEVTVSLESDEAIDSKAISFDANPGENLSIVNKSWTIGENVDCFMPGIKINSSGVLAVGLVGASVPEGTNELVTFSIAADEAFAGSEIKFTRVKVAGVNIEDFTVNVSNNDTPTAITSVKQNDNTDVIYNINGQRVNANAKGIVIKNGVKTINK